MKYGVGDKIFSIVNGFILVVIGLICIFPFFNVIATSFSSGDAITSGKVGLFPVGTNLEFYKKILADPSIFISFKFSVIMTAIFVVVALFMTTMVAYALSRKKLRGRKFFTVMIVVTMYFTGGIIPSYLVVQKLNLLNNMWGLILPLMINTYFMIIMKSFFSSIPESLLEAATIDGCNDIGILFRIVLPLSLPVLATMTLFYAVQRWNGFQDAVFYITDPDKYPLQMKLRALIQNQVNANVDVGSLVTVNPEGLKSACLILATLPILIVYPWLQKYFVKGMTLGGVKE
jgi:putative aldouronate transport system permease protein